MGGRAGGGRRSVLAWAWLGVAGCLGESGPGHERAIAGLPSDAPIDGASVQADTDTPIVTVPDVHYTLTRAATTWVEYGPTEALGASTAPTARGAGKVREPLLGLPAEATGHFRVVATEAGQTWRTDVLTLTTGALPDGLSEPEGELGGQVGLLLATMALDAVEGTAAPVVLDGDGRVVWYHLVEGDHVPSAHRTADGIVYLREGTGDAIPESTIVRVSLDGREVEELAAPYAHHDFVEAPVEGVRYAWIAADPREVAGETVVGDCIVEALEDGSTRRAWCAHDSLPVGETHANYYTIGLDWTHANGLAYDASDDTWLLSLYWSATILKIDRATGTIVWRLGGAESDFTFAGGDDFGPQHAPVALPGGVRLFDNAYGGEASRLVEYTLDTAAWVATPTWSWAPPDPTVARIMGDADRHEDGLIVSAWGETGEIVVADGSGAVVGSLDLGTGRVVGRTERLEGW